MGALAPVGKAPPGEVPVGFELFRRLKAFPVENTVLPRAYILHHIPGRLRIRVPEAKHNQALLEKLREALLSAPGVEAVDCNPLTGSMLIHYAPGPVGKLPAFLSAHNGSPPPFSVHAPQSIHPAGKVRRRRPGQHSEAAKSIMGFFGDLDDAIRTATGDQLDLRVLFPLAAAVLGIALMRRANATPLWLTMVIFGFSSFLVLHDPRAGDLELQLAELATRLEL